MQYNESKAKCKWFSGQKFRKKTYNLLRQQVHTPPKYSSSIARQNQMV
jgi:hypothetical protein